MRPLPPTPSARPDGFRAVRRNLRAAALAALAWLGAVERARADDLALMRPSRRIGAPASAKAPGGVREPALAPSPTATPTQTATPTPTASPSPSPSPTPSSSASTTPSPTANSCPALLYSESFESGLGGWTLVNSGYGAGNGLWSLKTACEAAQSGHSASTALGYSTGAPTCDYDAKNGSAVSIANSGAAISPAISLAGESAPLSLALHYFLSTIDQGVQSFDVAAIHVSRDGFASDDAVLAFNNSGMNDPSNGWETATLDISAYAGQTITLSATFDSGDEQFNNGPGFYIDDVQVCGPPPPTPSPSPSPSPPPPPPVFSLQPLSQIVNAGQAVAFHALAGGAAPISYAWVKDGTPLPSQTAPDLMIAAAAASDAGVYVCDAANPGGTTPSSGASLAVVSPPAANDATFFKASAPGRMNVDQQAVIGITMVNTSAVSWSPAQNYSLAVVSDPANLFQGATRLPIYDSTAIVPANGGIFTFVGLVQAPAVPGMATARLQMIEEFVGLFGQEASFTINFVTPPNSAQDWAAYE